jgi:hypothetical protein
MVVGRVCTSPNAPVREVGMREYFETWECVVGVDFP